MKKLMILGGSRFALPVIDIAHRLGIYVITCDYMPDNYAHKYSDEYCNVSIIEKEAVLEVAKRLQINGITSFACDPGVITAAYVADKMGLPNVGPYESVCILQNKGKFRKFLSDNGFHVPKAKKYTDLEVALAEAHQFHWPVIVKPVDSAGSKGVTKVNDVRNLRSSIEYALSYSHCGEYIIEDYIQQYGYSSDTDSFSVDGKMQFVSFNNQMFDSRADNPYTPAAYSWPSSMNIAAQKELQEEIQRLITLLHMRTSLYNIETRVGLDGTPYIMELSPRGGGNRLSECLKYATGVDLIRNMVKYSVGLPIDEIKQLSYDAYWGEIIMHSDHQGRFQAIRISDEIQKNIIEQDLWVTKDTEVGGFKAANEAIGTLIMRFDKAEDLEKVMSNQSQYFEVIVQ